MQNLGGWWREGLEQDLQEGCVDGAGCVGWTLGLRVSEPPFLPRPPPRIGAGPAGWCRRARTACRASACGTTTCCAGRCCACGAASPLLSPTSPAAATCRLCASRPRTRRSKLVSRRVDPLAGPGVHVRRWGRTRAPDLQSPHAPQASRSPRPVCTVCCRSCSSWMPT